MKKKLSLIGIAIVLALSLVMVVAPPASATATAVDILAPTAAVPATSNTGGSVEVTAKITVDSDDYYTVSIVVFSDGTDAGTIASTTVGSYSDLLYLTNGDTVITRLVSLYPGLDVVTDPFYGVMVTADAVSDTEGDGLTPTTAALMLGEIPGATIPTTLLGKSIIIVESVLDKFVSPSSLNDALYDGDAPGALNSEGTQLVDGVTNIALGGVDVAGEGVSMAGEILSAVRGAVTSKVPPIVNGALSLVAEIVALFSSSAPLAP